MGKNKNSFPGDNDCEVTSRTAGPGVVGHERLTTTTLFTMKQR